MFLYKGFQGVFLSAAKFFGCCKPETYNKRKTPAIFKFGCGLKAAMCHQSFLDRKKIKRIE
jgi:hypothetical protein